MNVNELDTPCVVIDSAIMNSNISRFQNYCTAIGVQFRPHIKTHKIPELALLQINAGAIGINCQKLTEAEVFADAGIKDILITFNILGPTKLSRLVELSKRCRLTVVADNIETVKQLSDTFELAGLSVRVLVECDTGGNRCGVQTPRDALDLALQINDSPGVEFSGLLTYPAPTKTQEANRWLLQAKELCTSVGLSVETISSGGSPNMYNANEFTVATEYRAGTYIYNDRSLVSQGSCKYSDCALTVVATVVSHPTNDRIVIDAGSKSLSSDLLGMEGYGYVVEYPEAKVYSLSEEHGCIDFSGCKLRPKIGDKLNIIPNHACVVSNLFDFVYLKLDGQVQKSLKVAARGKVL